MQLRRILKQEVPGRIRHLGWRGYYGARDKWLRPRLKAIVGCQTTRKIVALTFDDGPLPNSTPQILEILARYRVQATFFMLGQNVVAHSNTARQVAQAGHAIGNHTFTHPSLAECSPGLIVQELEQCGQAIRQATGSVPRVMRPPFGVQSATSCLIARAMGYAVVNWSASGDDWKGVPASSVAERVLADVLPGSIILLHDGSEPPRHEADGSYNERLKDRGPTIEALPIIIGHLQSLGYEFVRLPEMMRTERLIKQSWLA